MERLIVNLNEVLRVINKDKRLPLYIIIIKRIKLTNLLMQNLQEIKQSNDILLFFV